MSVPPGGVERFFKEEMINGRKASMDGPNKTFTLHGIKDSPRYLHDGRLLTLEDTVKFFNLILDAADRRGEAGPDDVPQVSVTNLTNESVTRAESH